MSTTLNIYLRSRIGAKPFLEYDPDENPGLEWLDADDRDLKKELGGGGQVIISRNKRRKARLTLDPVSDDDQQALQEIEETRQLVCMSPPWTENALAYLGLQGGLGDSRSTEGTVTFARKCRKANTVTGEWSGFDEPVYENVGDIGKGLHITDPAEHADYIDFGVKAYLSSDAADSGSITEVFFDEDEFDLSDYDIDAGDYCMISTEGETTNSFEVARIDAVDDANNGLDLAQTAATDAVLTNTDDYTLSNKTYVQFVTLVSDANMDEDGTGSWADLNTPSLVEKSATQNETGTRCLRVIGDSVADGAYQDIGSLPAGTDLVLMIRYKVLRGTLRLLVQNTTDSTNVIGTEDVTSSDWAWARYSGQVASGATDPSAIRLRAYQAGATNTQFLIDRMYIFKNAVDNGGMEGTYDDEDAGGAGTVNVAPGWDAYGVETDGADTLDEDTDAADVHGGDKAQSINVDAASEGIITAANIFTAEKWYYVGCYVKITTGTARLLSDGTNAVNVATSTSGSYTLLSGVAYMPAAASLLVRSSGGAADFLVDDVFAIRLPGNPHDDATYDLSEPLSTDGFLMAGMVKSTDQANNRFAFSRRTFDSDNQVYFNIPSGWASIIGTVRTGGSQEIATASVTHSAGEVLYYALRVDSSGTIKMFARAGSDDITTGDGPGTMTPATGITRMWLQYGTSYVYNRDITHSGILIENTGTWTDAEVEALLDRLTQDNYKKLLRKTMGVNYRIASLALTPYPAQADKSFGSCLLEEVNKDLGALWATQD